MYKKIENDEEEPEDEEGDGKTRLVRTLWQLKALPRGHRHTGWWLEGAQLAQPTEHLTFGLKVASSKTAPGTTSLLVDTTGHMDAASYALMGIWTTPSAWCRAGDAQMTR